MYHILGNFPTSNPSLMEYVMRELSLTEIGMVSGGVQDHKGGGGGGFGGGGGVGLSMATGSLSSMGGYVGGKVVTNEPIKTNELAFSGLTGLMLGYFGGPINSGKQAVDIVGSNTTAGILQAAFSNQTSNNNGSNKAGLDYQDTNKK